MTLQRDSNRSYREMTPEQQQRHKWGKRSHWVSERKKRVFLITYSLPQHKGNKYIAMQKAGIKDERTIQNWVETDELFADEYAAYREAWESSYAEQLRDLIPDSIQAVHDTIRQSKDWRSKLNAGVTILKSHDLIHDKPVAENSGVTINNTSIVITEVVAHEPAPRIIEGERPRELSNGD